MMLDEGEFLRHVKTELSGRGECPDPQTTMVDRGHHYENLYSPYNGSIINNRKKMLKNLSKQSDYDNKISVTEWQSNPKDSD